MFSDLQFFSTVVTTPEKPEVRKFQQLFTDFVMRVRGGEKEYVHQMPRIVVWLDLDPKVVEEDESDEEEHAERVTDSYDRSGCKAPKKSRSCAPALSKGKKNRKRINTCDLQGRLRNKRRLEKRGCQDCLADSCPVAVTIHAKPAWNCETLQCLESTAFPQVPSIASVSLVHPESTSPAPPVQPLSAITTFPGSAEPDHRQSAAFLKWTRTFAKELNDKVIAAGAVDCARGASCCRFLARSVE